MEDGVRDIMTRLFNHVSKTTEGNVATVGVTKSNIGNDVLIVYFKDPYGMTTHPEEWEGYSVTPSYTNKREQVS